jgi:hypothetical protein
MYEHLIEVTRLHISAFNSMLLQSSKTRFDSAQFNPIKLTKKPIRTIWAHLAHPSLPYFISLPLPKHPIVTSMTLRVYPDSTRLFPLGKAPESYLN